MLRNHHELQVHQVELEMQNAELRQTRDEVETVLGKYTDLYDFAPVGYFTLDREGIIRSVNLTGASLLGVERSRLIGRPFGPFVTGKARSVFTAFLVKVFTNPAKEAYVVKLLKEGNSPLFVQIEAMVAASGQECRIALIDITERKLAEEALQDSRQQNEFLADIIINAAQPFGQGYPDGRLGLINNAFEQLTGYTRDELLSINWVKTLTPPEWRESEREKLEELHRTGKPIRYEKEYIRKDGARVPIELLVHNVTDSGGNPQYYYSFITDITERKRAEEALRQAKEGAEAANRAKSQFLANMSHELRTPMTGVLGMLQLALEEENTPVMRDYLETTLTSARSLLRVLNDILIMAKIEAGKLTIEEKPFSLHRSITEAVDLITPEVRRKGLEFAISVAEEVPETVVGDELRLRQVLLNIIGNAVKFTEGGKVEVRVTVAGTASEGRREFTFAVTDTGIGIPNDKKELLFRAFSQVDDSHTRSYGGTGLGLAISREIMALMGGTISFKSEEEVGSTFRFTIPLGETGPESDALSVAESLSPETKTPVPEEERIPRLLHAEDDPVIRHVLELVLKRANYHIDFAEDGLKAVEMWENGEYDLVRISRCRGSMALRRPTPSGKRNRSAAAILPSSP
jgi:PAS domain S-box-containing protein